MRCNLLNMLRQANAAISPKRDRYNQASAGVEMLMGHIEDLHAGRHTLDEFADFYMLRPDASKPVEQCTLGECPPGLFRFDGTLCFKSEYSSKPGQPDAYCVESGEYFWGGTSGDIEARRALIVTPVSVPA